ncbi:4-oxalocrotonate tautomerase [Pseudomonas sp. RIT-PI-S]|uniref:tautomerase family protein n=1 Tax=Pseudomonas sp. RIT-PI-S TaxID=3035295 RepID=UPI0021DA8ECE|nr:4-oxalocrotonate tautomerase [Pseudomonas sp. RIT-PI-S]
MPGLTLTLSGDDNLALAQRIVPKLTALTCELLEKAPAQTMIIVRFMPHAQWFIENRSLVEYARNSFRLEVTITEETNTKAQKARYQRAAYELLAEEIGNLHPHSNIHIIDCPGTSYSYGGVTQEYRFQHG